MCGIAGIVSFSTPVYNQSVLSSMTNAIKHRGPDDETFYHDDHLALGFRRLSIIDLKTGQQPIWNDEHSVMIVVNGEIYNHLELRNELEPKHRFKTNSDSEALLHAYIEYGTDAFSRTNGMFAAVIWDKRNNSLVMARDRLGIKPLYYTLVNDTLIFASELKALLMHPECPRNINWHDLEILSLQQKSEISTYVEDVHYLDAGHYAVFDKDNNLHKHSYWDISSSFAKDTSRSPTDFCNAYNEIINDSVQKRLMSDVPIGIFLSGGIDSSLITSIAAMKNPNIHCFTVVERTTYRAGDVQQAQKVAKQYGVPFYPVLFDPDMIMQNFSLSDLEEMICLIESPRFDPEWFFKSELHRAAKQYVPDIKVILLGQGADEFAGGYSTFLGADYQSWEDYLQNSVQPDLEFYRNYNSGVPERLAATVQLRANPDKIGPYHEKMKLLTYQLQYFNLWHEDRTSSYHGIESRVPFLDHRLVELLASIPQNQHVELFWDKHIVRNALKENNPDYPQDKLKVPFFVTDDMASIDEFAWSIAMNTYPEFRNRYLVNAYDIKTEIAEMHFSNIVNRRYNMYESAWQLIEIMSIAIFERFLEAPEKLIADSFYTEKEHLPLVGDSDWQYLDQKYSQPSINHNFKACLAEDIINIPYQCEVLNPLTEEDGSTCLVLSANGKQVKRITINDKFYWLIQMIDEMGRYVSSPETAGFWKNKVNVNEQEFWGILNQLIAGGFIEKIPRQH